MSGFGCDFCSPNTITIIVQALAGVDRVTNPSAAIAGKQEESRDDFEIRRADSVSANAKNTDSAVRGSVANLPTVVDVWVKSNHDCSLHDGGTITLFRSIAF